MSTENRRRSAACLISFDTTGALTLAGSGAAWAEEPSTGESLRIVLGSQPQSSQIPLVYGVGHRGADFALFQSAVDEYVEEPPSEESLRELFALIQRYPFRTDDGGLSDDSVRFMIDIATESGVLTQPMSSADIVDHETLSRAVELANQ